MKSILGSDGCAPASPEACLTGLSAPDPKTLQIAFAAVDRGFPEYFKSAPLAPVPAHFVAAHGEAWAAHPDRPWNGAYMPEPGQDIDAILSDGALRLIPNPHHPDFAEDMIDRVVYLRSNFARVAAAREFTFHDKVPDIAFSVPDIREEAETFLKQNGWRVVSQDDVVFGFFAFDLDLIDPQLLEALKLLMRPDVIVARTPGSLGEPVTRLALIPSAAPLENRFAAMAPEKRLRIGAEVLEALGIGRDNPQSLTVLVFDEEAVEQVTVISNYLAEFGLELAPLLIGYGERQARFAAGEAVGLFVNWFTSTDDPGTLAGVLRWTATRFSPAGNDAALGQIAEANNLPDSERATMIAQVEAHVINEGGVIPVFRNSRKLIYRDWLCGVTGNLNQSYPTHWIRRCAD